MSKELILKAIAPSVVLIVVGTLVAMGKLDSNVLVAILAWFAPSPMATKVVVSRDSVESVR